MIASLGSRVRTARALGLPSVLRVAWYRARLRAGVHPVQRLAHAASPAGPFFHAASHAHAAGEQRATERYFGWFEPAEAGPPDWHRNPFTQARSSGESLPWWQLPDFDDGVGDIKTVWEASRWGWAARFAQRAATDDARWIETLNHWLRDWGEQNPPYRGLNWKCAQEASIRVMRLAQVALTLDDLADATPDLHRLLALHLRRIAPTVGYAMGQDNNHGTSEAAALVIGGSWLRSHDAAAGDDFARLGHRLLVDRVRRLVAPDGSFSQHSIVYHRLMLDTLSLTEAWRRRLALDPLAPVVTDRAAAAVEWLRAMTDPATGAVPNLGANDGANLLPLDDVDERDFRPSVQLAAVLFAHRRAYEPAGSWDAHLRWLRVASPRESLPPVRSRLFDDGGYALLHTDAATAILRYPRFRFRPSHADALHLDLFAKHVNVLRDGGTFSYAAGAEVDDYFAGAQGHNTIALDDHSQMVRLGRFLWGDWLETLARGPLTESGGVVTMSAAYRDRFGASHARRVELRSDSVRVEDTVRGIARRAVLRWRLRSGPWRLTDTTASDEEHRILITADVPIARIAIVPGWESVRYMQRSPLPVLEVEIQRDGRIVSDYRWNA